MVSRSILLFTGQLPEFFGGDLMLGVLRLRICLKLGVGCLQCVHCHRVLLGRLAQKPGQLLHLVSDSGMLLLRGRLLGGQGSMSLLDILQRGHQGLLRRSVLVQARRELVNLAVGSRELLPVPGSMLIRQGLRTPGPLEGRGVLRVLLRRLDRQLRMRRLLRLQCLGMRLVAFVGLGRSLFQVLDFLLHRRVVNVSGLSFLRDLLAEASVLSLVVARHAIVSALDRLHLLGMPLRHVGDHVL
mmetsp:Transcript_139137/g.444471  ORF Transcript_139137/g.444471 Transcript_139137/m.444471 type:complete len:242 (-) Transcript_139137:2797-3522(-)